MLSPKDAVKLVTIGKRKEIYLDTSHVNYPFLVFGFLVDSKANVPLEIGEISANVYMQSSYMGKIRWTTLDNLFEDESYRISQIPALGETWINLRFTPPKDFLKSKSPTNWTLKGVVLFKPINQLGATKTFSVDFRLKREDCDRATEVYFER